MNKFFVLVAVVACAGIAVAHRHRHGPIHEHEGEHIGHHRHPGKIHFHEEDSFEEYPRRHHKGGRHYHGKRGLRRPHGLRGVGAFEESGFAASGGALGANEFDRERLGAFGEASHLGHRGSFEAGKSGLLAGEKHFNAGAHDDHLRDVEGSHKHTAFNNDKTIIKDKSSGVSDSDSFRNTDIDSKGGQIGGGASGIAAKQSGVRVEGSDEFDQKAGAVGVEKDHLSSVNAIGGSVAGQQAAGAGIVG